MEFRQGEPEDPNPDTSDGFRLLYRNIISSALRELGLGDLSGVPVSRNWRDSPLFDEACCGADWGKDWIESIFIAIEDLHTDNDVVRQKLTRESVRLLRELARE